MKYKDLDDFLASYSINAIEKFNRRPRRAKDKVGQYTFDQEYQQLVVHIIRPKMRKLIDKVKRHEGVDLTSVTTFIDVSLDYIGSVGYQPSSNFQVSFLPDKEEQVILVKVSFFKKPIENYSKTYDLGEFTDEKLEQIIFQAFVTAERILQEY